MKYFILFFIGIFSSSVCSQNLVGESRILSFKTSLINNKTSALTDIPIPNGSKFTIVDGKDDNYKIYFWDWDKKDSKYNLFNVDPTTKSQMYFLISKEDIDLFSDKIFSKFSPIVGTLSLPFKYRPQDRTFESTFSLSVTGGVKWNPFLKNEQTFSILVGVGPSTVRLTDENTNNENTLEDDFTTAAVTFSLSFVYQWDILQIGISGGFDNLIDNNKYNWKYQGKSWFSIGIGIGLFSKNENAKPSGNG